MKKRFLSILLSLIMLFNTISVLADTNQTIDYDESISATDEFEQEVEFTMSKGSTFTVCLPKEIVVQGETEYSVNAGIYADLNPAQKLIVEPTISNFVLKNIVSEGKVAKEDISVEVTSVKTEWLYNSTDFCADVASIILPENQVSVCSVSIHELPSGRWEGELPIRIALEAADLSISVTAKDSNGVDLNATSSVIVGDEKDNLLNGLVESGIIGSVEEVDALIEVNSDEFDNIAETTFDVSSIAQAGDIVTILHFDETKQEWEHIGTETVNDEGLIYGDFTSYSPVAFVKVDKVTGETSHLHNYIETETKAATCTVEGELTHSCSCGDTYVEAIAALGHALASSGKCNNCNYIEYIDLQIDSDTCKNMGLSLTGVLSIPETVLYNGKYYRVTALGWDAFRGCTELTGINIPTSVTIIRDRAFSYCTNLASVSIPNTVTSIGYEMFIGCTNLSSVSMPTSVTSIGDRAFMGCTSLSSLPVSTGVTSIGIDAFRCCTGITSVSIPTSVTSIGDSAFSKCTNLSSVSIPTSVTSIGAYAFSSTPWLTAKHNKQQLIILGDGVLYDGSTVSGSISIPSTVKTISKYAFAADGNITSVTIPYSVSSIEFGAFYHCTNLKSITWRGVTYTDKTAFNQALLNAGVATSDVWN